MHIAHSWLFLKAVSRIENLSEKIVLEKWLLTCKVTESRANIEKSMLLTTSFKWNIHLNKFSQFHFFLMGWLLHNELQQKSIWWLLALRNHNFSIEAQWIIYGREQIKCWLNKWGGCNYAGKTEEIEQNRCQSCLKRHNKISMDKNTCVRYTLLPLPQLPPATQAGKNGNSHSLLSDEHHKTLKCKFWTG